VCVGRAGAWAVLLIICCDPDPGSASARGGDPGLEEFRIEVEPLDEPGERDGQGAIRWRVEIRACPFKPFVDMRATIRPRFTLADLEYLRRRQGQPPDIERMRAIGDLVRESILDGPMETALVASVVQAQRQGKGLRFVVDLKDGKVAKDTISPVELPYEAIRLPQITTLGDFPAAGSAFTVGRTLAQPPVVPREAFFPVRLLVVASSPINEPVTRADESIAALRTALKGVAFDQRGEDLRNGAVTVKVCKPPTFEEFRRVLRDEGPWHIVHFVGHGAFRREGGLTPRPHLLFEKEDRQKDYVGAQEFASAVDQPELKLVILSACSSATAGPVDPGRDQYPASAFDGIAHHVLRSSNVSAVVAMQFDFEVEAARTFAGEFYKSLLVDQRDIDIAVSRARKELADEFGFARGVWITPVLYTRSRDGRVFEFRQRLGLAGTVVDSETLRPLPGVKLTIDDLDDINGQTPSAVTDEAGRFRFQGLPPVADRQVRLVAQRPGYEVSRTDPTLGNLSHDIKLKPRPPGSQ
jgi:CHAT domain/Carboxypeptidase regulatory-like domain